MDAYADVGILVMRGLTNLLDFEESALGAEIALQDFVRPRDNGGSCSPADAIVVCLADSPDDADARLDEKMLGQIRDPLLRDHEGRPAVDDVLAHRMHLLLLLLQETRPFILLRYLYTRLTLALLILQWTVKEQHLQQRDGRIRIPTRYIQIYIL